MPVPLDKSYPCASGAIPAARQIWAAWCRWALACVALLCAHLLLAGAAQAQTIPPTVVADSSFDTSIGADNLVESTVLQPDGKVLIGGYFTSVNGTPVNSIARLNADGSLDTSFDPGTGANNFVGSIALQPDGKVLIGGAFTSVNGTPVNSIARLNANGSLDTSFNLGGSGANNFVASITLQPDGKVLIGGAFTSVNGTPFNSIARLNTDGSLDTSFDPGTGADSLLYSIALQPDGKMLIGGWYTVVDGVARGGIARLNANGSLDTGFGTSGGTNEAVSSIALQPDGKMLIVGNFTTVNGVARRSIARLNADGSLDTGFDPGTGAENLLYSTVLQPDGKVLIGGSLTAVNGTPINGIARLNADGSLDTSFDPGSGVSDQVRSIALQPGGKVLIGGYFTNVNGVARGSIARLAFQGTATTSVPGGQGTISPASYTAAAGSPAYFTLTPDAGYVVDTVAGTCGGTLSGNVFTTAALSGNCTVIASFKPAGTGTGTGTAATPVPTLGPWALVGLLGVIGLVGGRRLRRV